VSAHGFPMTIDYFSADDDVKVVEIKPKKRKRKEKQRSAKQQSKKQKLNNSQPKSSPTYKPNEISEVPPTDSFNPLIRRKGHGHDRKKKRNRKRFDVEPNWEEGRTEKFDQYDLNQARAKRTANRENQTQAEQGNMGNEKLSQIQAHIAKLNSKIKEKASQKPSDHRSLSRTPEKRTPLNQRTCDLNTETGKLQTSLLKQQWGVFHEIVIAQLEKRDEEIERLKREKKEMQQERDKSRTQNLLQKRLLQQKDVTVKRALKMKEEMKEECKKIKDEVKKNKEDEKSEATKKEEDLKTLQKSFLETLDTKTQERIQRDLGAIIAAKKFCSICKDQPKTMLLLPCKHMFCSKCSDLLDKCDICGTSVKIKINIFS